MRDEDLRALDRVWTADPGDQAALQRAIAARRRSGIPVPGWMLAKQVFPARSFRTPVPLWVHVQLPDGRTLEVGRASAAGLLAVPAHHALWVQPEPPTDEALVALANDRELSLEVQGLALAPDVTDDGLATLPRLAVLTRLDLSGCTELTDDGLAHVAKLRTLELLDLWSVSGVTDHGVARLASLRALSSLNLRHCVHVTDAGLRSIGKLAELHTLSLGACLAIGDAGLRHLGGLRRLAALDLGDCPRITDAGLEHLSSLGELTMLNLSRCAQLTPDGLAALGRLKKLAQLFILGCGAASEKATRVLAPLLPQCAVVASG